MTVTIELAPELEKRLRQEAARRGQAPADFVRTAVEEKLGSALRHSKQEALELLRQWRKEDAEHPDMDPPPIIPPLSLREVDIG